MTESIVPTYLCLKTASAQKLGRNGGGITYKLLTDANAQQLYLTLVANDGGGYYSQEIVTFDAVMRCLPTDDAQTMAAKSFAPAFVGRSANNPGFMAAILRAEGLLAGVDGKPHLHAVVGDWDAWKRTILALPGEPYVPPVKESKVPDAAAEIPRQELPGEGEAETPSSQRKGKKIRVIKPAEGADHAHPA